MTRRITAGEVATPVTVALPAAVVAALDTIAAREGATRSELGREAFALLIAHRKRAREERLAVRRRRYGIARMVEQLKIWVT